MHEECQCDECKKERAEACARPLRSRKEIMEATIDQVTGKLILEVLLDIRDIQRVQDARISDIRDTVIEILHKDPVVIRYPRTYWYPQFWCDGADTSDYDYYGDPPTDGSWKITWGDETTTTCDAVADYLTSQASIEFTDKELFDAITALDPTKPHKKRGKFTFLVR